MLNRYFTKTLFKGIALQRSVMNATFLAGVHDKSLLMVTKRAFFDYSNKDKDIFSSDSSDDEGARGKRGKKNQRDVFNDDFEGSPRSNKHEGKYEVSEIPLYITKMRNEIQMKQKDRTYKGEYFGKIKNLIAMHHQNQEKIFAEFPRFQNVMYDYMAYRGMYGEHKFLSLLEDFIVKENLSKMPLPGIRNFLQGMAMLGRGRPVIIDQVKEHLTQRNAFNDLKSNLPICGVLTNISHLSKGEDNDYLHKTMRAIQNEISIQQKEGVCLIGQKDKVNKSAKFCITSGTIKAIYTFVGKTLAVSDLSFTEEEVKSVHSKLKMVKMGDVDFPTIEGDNLTLKESILLAIFQYAHTHASEVEDYRQLVITKMINMKHPEIAKVCTELSTIQENSEKAFKEAMKEDTKKAMLTPSEQKIANVLDELGVFYSSGTRVGDVFRAQFLLPNDNIVFEYLQMIDFVKTDDIKADQVLGGRYLFRRKFLELSGYKVVNISSFDIIDTDNSHTKLVEIIKEKLGIASKTE